ncbi:hypothetical protein ONE63_011541 [Megalurothrips usitatus]|uniref:Endonuclease/exonuclease/phosphatase domain-containing protein n=1 Tax=Megalurothrips usitatus TaxID=439358 RepID=A0AAV7X2I3_9NEOP|nr:hypothetical protein ONE63_011541 [Megalurothrips usitatus]
MRKSQKTEFLHARKDLRVQDLQGFPPGPRSAIIYINESLSREMRMIFNRVRALKVEKRIHDVWFFNGKLFVKKTEKGNRIQVKSEDHLTSLVYVMFDHVQPSFTPNLTSGTPQALVNLCHSFPNKLKIVHVNAESLNCRSHADMFHLLFANSQIDVIAVSETFYRCQSDVLRLKNYNTFTANRNSSGGGGVAIYVKNTHDCKRLSKSNSDPTGNLKKPDYAIIEICLSDTKIIFGCVYRPPKGGYFDEFGEDFMSLGIDYKFHIVAGDVNAHSGSMKPCDIRDGKAVYDFLELYNLSRVPYDATFHIEGCDSHLDMIASTCHEQLVYHSQLHSGMSNHDLLVSVFSFGVPKFTPRQCTFRSFRNFNPDALKKDVVEAPWHDMFHLEDVNAKLEFFNCHLTALFNKHAPYVTVQVKHRPTPWMTDDLRILMAERDRMYNDIKNCKDKLIFEQFRKLRNRTKCEIRNAKVRYSHKILNNCTSSGSLWKNLKKTLRYSAE